MWFYTWKSVFICGDLYIFPVVFITVINDALSPCSRLSYLFIVLAFFFFFEPGSNAYLNTVRL